MADGLEDIFAEEMEAGDDSVEIEPVEDIENPDDGADDFEDPTDADDEDDIDIDDADTDDDEPPADEDDDFDWNEIVERYGDRTIQLTVNGEVVEKPLKDLPSMAMMREDYSRKTAEVASKAKAAQWAQDVQESFAKDPEGTLEAFARAYNIQIGAPQAPVDETDPYEDFDPEVAQVLRQRDELLAYQQQQLEQLTSRYDAIENDRIMAEVKSEVAELKGEFGDELDHVEMLRIAAAYNMPLREAAEHLVGKQSYYKSRQQQELDSEAGKIGARKADQVRRTAKKRASGTSTKKFDASDVSVEDFSDIGELFEINLNSMT